jgi:hypothetical protein
MELSEFLALEEEEAPAAPSVDKSEELSFSAFLELEGDEPEKTPQVPEATGPVEPVPATDILIPGLMPETDEDKPYIVEPKSEQQAEYPTILVTPSEYKNLVAEKMAGEDVDLEKYTVRGLGKIEEERKAAEEAAKIKAQQKRDDVALAHKFYESGLSSPLKYASEATGIERSFYQKTIGEAASGSLKSPLTIAPASLVAGQTIDQRVGSAIRQSMEGLRQEQAERDVKEMADFLQVSEADLKKLHIMWERKADIDKEKMAAGEMNRFGEDILDRGAFYRIGGANYDEYAKQMSVHPSERDHDKLEAVLGHQGKWIRQSLSASAALDIDDAKQMFYDAVEHDKPLKLSEVALQSLMHDQSFAEEMKEIGMLMAQQPVPMLRELGAILTEQWPVIVATDKGVTRVLSSLRKMKQLHTAGKLSVMRKVPLKQITAEQAAKDALTRPTLFRIGGEELVRDAALTLTAGQLYETGRGNTYGWRELERDFVFSLFAVGPSSLIRTAFRGTKLSPAQFDQATKNFNTVAGLEKMPHVNKLMPMFHKLSKARALDDMQVYIKPDDLAIDYLTAEQLTARGYPEMAKGMEPGATKKVVVTGESVGEAVVLRNLVGPDGVIEETAHFIQDYIQKMAAKEGGKGRFSSLNNMIHVWEVAVRNQAAKLGIEIPQGRETFAQAFTVHMGYAKEYAEMSPGVLRLAIPDEILRGMHQIMGDDPVLRGDSYHRTKTITGEPMTEPKKPVARDYDSEIKTAYKNSIDKTLPREEQVKYRRIAKDVTREKAVYLDSHADVVLNSVDESLEHIRKDPNKIGLKSFLESVKAEIDEPIQRSQKEIDGLKKSYAKARQMYAKTKEVSRYEKAPLKPAYQMKPSEAGVQKKIERHYGTTKDIFSAGFITPGGQMLDLERGFGRKGFQYHDDIDQFMDAKKWRAVEKFMDMGNIRLSPRLEGGFSLNVKPTPAQRKTLANYIKKRQVIDSKIVVEIQPGQEQMRKVFDVKKGYKQEGKFGFYREYGFQVPTSKILKDIDNYFDGVEPAPLSLAQQFHQANFQLKEVTIRGKKQKHPIRIVGKAHPHIRGNPWRELSLEQQKSNVRKLYDLMEDFAEQGKAGKYWYEESSNMILSLTGGNVEDAKTLAKLIAVSSPQSTVQKNAGDAIKLFYQYRHQRNMGVPLDNMKFDAGMFPKQMEPRFRGVFAGEPLHGPKVNDFYKNLMVNIEDIADAGITADSWMARAAHFSSDKLTKARYDFVQNMVKNIAADKGWKPWQAQAAIWQSIKSKWDAVNNEVLEAGVKKGWAEVAEYETVAGKKKYFYSAKDDAGSQRAYHQAMIKSIGKDPFADIEKFSFVDAVDNLESRVSWEATPGKSTKHLEGIHDAPFDQRYEYTYAVLDELLDEDGNNIIFKELGLLDRDFVYMPGSWLGEVNPSLHFRVPVPRKSGAGAFAASIDETAEKMLEGAAAALGYFTHQEGVGWHVPRWKAAVGDANGIQLNVGKPLTVDQVAAFEKGLVDIFGDEYFNHVALIPSDEGPRILNWGGEFKGSELTNARFHDIIKEVGEKTLPNDFEEQIFSSTGNLIENNWKEFPDGSQYRQKIVTAGGQDLLRRLEDVLAPRLAKVDEAFREKYGWGKPREVTPIPDQAVLKPGIDGSAGAVPATVYQLKSHADTPPPGHSGPGGQTFDMTPESNWEASRRYFQDKFFPVARLQRDMKKAGNIITEQTDVYGKEILYHGRTATKIEDLEKYKIDPLIKYMKDNGINLKTLDDYVAARHAPERNAQIAKINPEMPDGGSGITNQQAATMLDEFRRMGKDKKLEAAARMIDEFHRIRQQIAVDAGLMTQETLNLWNNTYKKYMPLRGFEDMDDAPAGAMTGAPGTSKGYGDFIKEKRAMGRKSRAFSPVTNSLAMLMNTVERAEKNRVGQSFYKLVQENPNQKLWRTDKIEMKPQIDPHSGMVVYRKKVMISPGPNEFPVKINGEQHVITIEDPHLASALKNLGVNNTGGFVRSFATYNRMMAAINTSLYPVFVASNFVRDAITAGIHMTGEQGAKHSFNMLRNTPKAIAGILAHHAGKGKNWEYVKLFQQYREVGGKMGFFGLKGIEDMHREIIDKLGDGIWGKTVRTKDAILRPIELVNEAVENGVRLASFKECLDMGMSPERAAIVAKELTVNFNRKGEIGSALNAFYLFYNASLQGNFRMGGALLTNKKIQGIAAAATLQSFLIAEYNRGIAGTDDSGRNRWDNVPPWVKERSLVFMDRDESGKFTKIPLPYGYNIFNVLGNSISEMIHGGKPVEAAVNLAVATSSAFNPLGNQSSKTPTGALIKTVVPSALQPGVQHILNENFAGIPIKPENYPFGAPSPESELYFKGVRPITKALTKNLNTATGGTINRPGKIDVSPEIIDHYYETYTGGLGKFVGNVVNLIYSGYTGGEVATRDIPFWNRFRGEIFDSVNLTRFYNLSETLAQYEADERVIRRSGTPEEKKLVEASKRARETSARLKQINKRIADFEAQGYGEEKLEKFKKLKRKEADRFLLWYKENLLDKGLTRKEE